jgi:hypothetical protein
MDRNMAMGALDVLVGEWTFDVLLDDGSLAVSGRSVFEWRDGGAFLKQYTESGPPPAGQPREWAEHAPFPVDSMIGLPGPGRCPRTAPTGGRTSTCATRKSASLVVILATHWPKRVIFGNVSKLNIGPVGTSSGRGWLR